MRGFRETAAAFLLIAALAFLTAIVMFAYAAEAQEDKVVRVGVLCQTEAAAKLAVGAFVESAEAAELAIRGFQYTGLCVPMSADVRLIERIVSGVDFEGDAVEAWSVRSLDGEHQLWAVRWPDLPVPGASDL